MESNSDDDFWNENFGSESIEASWSQFISNLESFFLDNHLHYLPPIPLKILLRFAISRSDPDIQRNMISKTSFETFLLRFGPFHLCLKKSYENLFQNGQLV